MKARIEKMTVDQLRRWKAPPVLAALTAYDYPMARLLDEAGVRLILVGDSLGMVVLGYPDTTRVTMAEMTHHLKAVVRAKPKALVAADLPSGSYRTPREAADHALRLRDAGAEAVKAEGGRAIGRQIEAIIGAGVPYIGHLGMLPQHVLEEGCYRIKGKEKSEKEALIEDARFLEDVGAVAVVLELVTPPVARELTAAIRIPTIGIGSGEFCDGQIRVTHDIVGLFPWFTPRFVIPKVQCADAIRKGVVAWMAEVARDASVSG